MKKKTWILTSNFDPFVHKTHTYNSYIISRCYNKTRIEWIIRRRYVRQPQLYALECVCVCCIQRRWRVIFWHMAQGVFFFVCLYTHTVHRTTPRPLSKSPHSTVLSLNIGTSPGEPVSAIHTNFLFNRRAFFFFSNPPVLQWILVNITRSLINSYYNVDSGGAATKGDYFFIIYNIYIIYPSPLPFVPRLLAGIGSAQQLLLGECWTPPPDGTTRGNNI